MPDAQGLNILRQLREMEGITQAQMANFFGLKDSARSRMSKWENGDEIPSVKYRSDFIQYLLHTLKLENDIERFMKIWSIISERWDWPKLSDIEMRKYFVYAPKDIDDLVNVHLGERLRRDITLSLKALFFNPGSIGDFEENIQLIGKSGDLYIIDLAYTFNLGGIKYLTIINLQYWDIMVSRNQVQILYAVMDEVAAHKGILVSTVGFDSSAVHIAAKYGIALVKVSDIAKPPEIMSNLTGPKTEDFVFSTSLPYTGGKIKEIDGVVYAKTHIIDYIAEHFGEELAIFLSHEKPIHIDNIIDNWFKARLIRQVKYAWYPEVEYDSMKAPRYLIDYLCIETGGCPFAYKVEPYMYIRMINLKIAIALSEINKMEPKPIDDLINALNECNPLSQIAHRPVLKLESMKEEALEDLLSCLGESRYRIRRWAISLLGEIGEPAFTPLCEALSHHDQQTRLSALDALRDILSLSSMCLPHQLFTSLENLLKIIDTDNITEIIQYIQEASKYRHPIMKSIFSRLASDEKYVKEKNITKLAMKGLQEIDTTEIVFKGYR